MGKEEWRRILRSKVERAREALGAFSLEELARRGGGKPLPQGLELPFFGEPYLITWPGLRVLGPKGEAPEEVAALLFDYLLLGDGTRPQGDWIGFRELPHGGFYFQAFQGYTGDLLVRELDLPSFRRAAEALGGELLALADAAFLFWALPRLPLAVVWWEGDDELPPKVTMLFDRTAGRYLPPEGLAILGRILCQRLIQAARV